MILRRNKENKIQEFLKNFLLLGLVHQKTWAIGSDLWQQKLRFTHCLMICGETPYGH
jgi:hypothetical protein